MAVEVIYFNTYIYIQAVIVFHIKITFVAIVCGNTMSITHTHMYTHTHVHTHVHTHLYLSKLMGYV